MSEYRKTTPNDLYFVPLTIESWVDLFTRKECEDIIIWRVGIVKQDFEYIYSSACVESLFKELAL